jgi:hypothetical protein
MTFRKFPGLVHHCAVAAAVVLAIILTAPAVARAQTITLTWDPNSEPNLAGYIVHSGTQSRSYSNQTDAGRQTSLPITGLDFTKDTYFAVQAYSTDGLLSPLSQEVVLPAVVATPTTITSLTASVGVPLLVGTPVTWTAGATSSTGAVEYKFLLFGQQTGWRIVQDFSTSPSFTWTPGWNDIGKAALQVWVRTVGSTAPYEAWRGVDTFEVSTEPASLKADTEFPSPSNQPVVWTASVTGATSPLEYKFLLLDKMIGAWVVLRDYAASNQVTWTPTHNGKYALQVWARRIGSGASYESWTSSGEFDITPSKLSVVSIDVDKALPALTGTTITWSARTRGGTTGPLLFKFVRYSAQSASWNVVQDYSTSRTYTWTPTWGDDGFHVLQVWVKNNGSPAGYDAWLATEPIELRRAPLQLTSDKVFPVAPSVNVRWTAEVPDPTVALEYSFYVYDRAQGTWRVGRQYNTNNTFDWTAGVSGTFALQAWARKAGSSSAYDVWRGTDYVEVFNSPAKMKSLTTDVTFPVSVGTPITWTATASGGTSALEYRFVIYNAASGWKVLKEYSQSTTATWTPAAHEAGTYAIQVWVRSTGSAVAFEDWQGTSFFQIRP